MVTINKDELAKMNNLRADAREKIARLQADLIRYKKQEEESQAWMESHMKVVYPHGGSVALPKEGGKGSIVLVRREADEGNGHYIFEIHNAD